MTTASLITLLKAEALAGGAVFAQVLPRAYALPAVVVHRYNGTRDQDMSGPMDVREDNFQLDLYGATQADCDAVTDAARNFLTGYVGTLADGAVVSGTYLEQDRDMPYLANADVKTFAFRALLGFRFVTKV
jgi:hypothetical protein